MSDRKFLNIHEFCQELGISESTYRRRKKENGVALSHRLLSPVEQRELASKLGLSAIQTKPGLAACQEMTEYD